MAAPGTRPLTVGEKITAEIAKSLVYFAEDGRRFDATVVQAAQGVYIVEFYGGAKTVRLRLLDLSVSELWSRWCDFLREARVEPPHARKIGFAAVLRNASRHGATADLPMPLCTIALPSFAPGGAVARAAAWVFRDRGYATAMPRDVHVLLPTAAGI